MKLVIFDIDGTLTDTVGVDDACFLAVVREALGGAEVEIDLETFAHVTDSHIASHLVTRHRGAAPTPEELRAMEAQMGALLEAEAAAAPQRFRPIAGALASFERLREEPGWVVALASGAWRRSGEVKLRTAGFEVAGVPAAFANDAEERTGIVLTALRGARERYVRPLFDQVVMVGDGPWDVATARALGMGFVGIAREERRRERLEREGARVVLANYHDHGALRAALEQALVPGA